MDKKKQEVSFDNVLSDKKRGKENPWKPKKVRTLKLSDSFKRLGTEYGELYTNKSVRVRDCGSILVFRPNHETGDKNLVEANFCRERLCPMCQWRRTKKLFSQVSKVMDRVQQENPTLVPLFLTLTVKNCSPEELAATLDKIFYGLSLFWKLRKIKRVVKGFFRALEVTYNEEHDTFHPHIHVIIFVEKDYFKKDNKDYMQTADWVKMWRTCLKLDYDPICDIRRVRYGRKKHKAISEVTKYTVKDSDFIYDDTELTDKLVYILGKALRKRRLFAFGGLLDKTAKEMKLGELAEGDLVHIDDEEIRTDVAMVLEVYKWHFGFANYVRVGMIEG